MKLFGFKRKPNERIETGGGKSLAILAPEKIHSRWATANDHEIQTSRISHVHQRVTYLILNTTSVKRVNLHLKNYSLGLVQLRKIGALGHLSSRLA